MMNDISIEYNDQVFVKDLIGRLRGDECDECTWGG